MEPLVHKVTKDPKQYYKQHFRKEWQQMDDFRGWLFEVPGDSRKAYCQFCDCSVGAKYYDIVKHKKTKKHLAAEVATPIAQTVLSFMEENYENNIESTPCVSENQHPKTQPQKTSPQKKKIKLEGKEDALSCSFRRLQEQNDEFEKIGAAWACELRKMDPLQQMFAKKAINDVLFEGQLGTLGRNSVIINSPPPPPPPTPIIMHSSSFGHTDNVSHHHSIREYTG